MSVGGQAQKTTQNNNTSTAVDPETQARMRAVWDAAQAAGTAGPSGLTTDAAGYNSGLMKSGQTGLAALTGDKTALAGLMDPYQSQVIDATNAQWNQADQRAHTGVNGAATAAGAFGGARHGVVEGTALAANNMNRNSQVSGLLSSGYQDAMQRAGALASGGFNAAGANAGLGMAGVGSPQQWLMQMLRNGFMGPAGTNTGSSGATTQAGGNTSFKVPFFG